ncbi:hypothetical protein [Bacillus sp. RS11]|uniref:hypothetical protein n=1 Tax=Lysinibacillus sp. RS11 TaxID=3242682 RepID=UPI0035C78982
MIALSVALAFLSVALIVLSVALAFLSVVLIALSVALAFLSVALIVLSVALAFLSVALIFLRRPGLSIRHLDSIRLLTLFAHTKKTSQKPRRLLPL